MTTATMGAPPRHGAEARRLAEADRGERAWRRWGPYLAERQWGTVREDYSENGDCWTYFPHDHARSRAYRWGEDGLLGVCDEESRLCFALALWNGKDPILKERLFGLTGPEGNHGEDVKEHYFYLDSTPTHSYMKSLYKYPQAEFPYTALVEENRRRGRAEPEFEIDDTGVFEAGRYFDAEAEYAKAGPEELLIRITITNRGPEAAPVHVLPTLWFRNTWSWEGDPLRKRPLLRAKPDGRGIIAEHAELGEYELTLESGTSAELLFTENETNAERLFGALNTTPYVKDAFHARVVAGAESAVNPSRRGTKAAFWCRLSIGAGERVELRLRLRRAEARPTGDFDRTIESRRREADEFYRELGHDRFSEEDRAIARQAAAGLLWSKQFFHIDVRRWLEGDPAQPAPPANRRNGRNAEWAHLNNADIVSMPDKWEYPWYAAWDLAFQMIPFAKIDPEFAKAQLVLFLREWYMHPNGQVPAYEFAFGDVNPPVHAWAVWRVYKMTGAKGARDRPFLARCFQKLLLNFTWWVNRKDPEGKNLFAGGFLGLDNIGVFDRSRPLPTGGRLEQADGTAWMAFYCGTMLNMALELAREDAAYEDMATKFFEHFVAITDAMNTLGGAGLWDEEDGFYYDRLHAPGAQGPIPLRVRSLVGLIPLLAVEVLENETIDRLPDFKRRMEWFLRNRADLPFAGTCNCGHGAGGRRLLAIPTRERLERVVQRLVDEDEFLSPFGVRSLSRFHERQPYVFRAGGEEHRVAYVPGESDTGLFGGNSNWRGPIWFPINFLMVEALERYDHYYSAEVTVELPRGSGNRATLGEVAGELRRRLSRLFERDQSGSRPCHGGARRFAEDPHWKDLVYFHEHFHGETGRGLGATHQTGWTALVLSLLHRAETPNEAARRGCRDGRSLAASAT